MDKDSDTADQELTSYLQDDGERSRLEHRYLTALEARVAQLDALLKSAYPPDLDAYNRQNEGLKNGLDASASDPDEVRASFPLLLEVY